MANPATHLSNALRRKLQRAKAPRRPVAKAPDAVSPPPKPNKKKKKK